MNKYNREYDSFEIFEQIQEEKAPQSPSSGRRQEVLSFDEAPYYEIEYDAGPVQAGGTMQELEDFSLFCDMIQEETGADSVVTSLNGRWGVEGDRMPVSDDQEFHLDRIQSDLIRANGIQSDTIRPDRTQSDTNHPDRIQSDTIYSDRIQSDEICPDRTQSTPICPERIQPNRIQSPEQKDEVRELFNRMREIAREDRYLNFRSSKFYDQRMQRENSKTFYRQGMFMKDFEDEYAKAVPYSSYFPAYQMMGYDQLRTFFTWRTQVRHGKVEHISLSYAYLYIYELLNNIGVDDPEEGFGQLLFFWDAFRVYDRSVDKYVPKWLKDYYIYYGLPGSFPDFVEENGLQAYYPGLKDEEDHFESYCTLSKYDIRKSAFYAEGREDMVKRCFAFTMERLREAFSKCGFELDSLLFQPARNMSVWIPFKGALFYPSVKQQDRTVALSRKEVYVCRRNEWTFSAMITADSGKRLLGYVLKQMEAVLRKLTKYKYKLSANPDMLSPVMADELRKAGINPEVIVTDAVMAFYKEETKTVVRVNPGMLEKIRQEAYVTQERLIVEEEPNMGATGFGKSPAYVNIPGMDREAFPETGNEAGNIAEWSHAGHTGGEAFPQNTNKAQENRESGDVFPISANEAQRSREDRNVVPEQTDSWKCAAYGEILSKDHAIAEEKQAEGLSAFPIQNAEYDEWQTLAEALTEPEMEALRIILYEKSNLKQFADGQGIMLEVLAEGINEKAADAIGDGLLDNEFSIYEDYVNQVKDMLDSMETL